MEKRMRLIANHIIDKILEDKNSVLLNSSGKEAILNK